MVETAPSEAAEEAMGAEEPKAEPTDATEEADGAMGAEQPMA